MAARAWKAKRGERRQTERGSAMACCEALPGYMLVPCLCPLKSVKTFADVKGCDEAKAELEEIVEYLKNPAKFTRLGGKLPKVCCCPRSCAAPSAAQLSAPQGRAFTGTGQG